MSNFIKFFFTFIMISFISGCEFETYTPNHSIVANNVSWHRNYDGVFYGKTCIDKRLFIVSSTPHNRETLSGVIGSCTGNEPFIDKPAPYIDENFKWTISESGIAFFYTCIEDHLFTVSSGSYHTSILALVENNCKSIKK